MRQRTTLQRQRYHVLARSFVTLADRIRNFIRFAITIANTPFAVSGNYQRAKTEVTAAFDHFAATVNRDNIFVDIAIDLFVLKIFTFSHVSAPKISARLHAPHPQ